MPKNNIYIHRPFFITFNIILESIQWVKFLASKIIFCVKRRRKNSMNLGLPACGKKQVGKNRYWSLSTLYALFASDFE